MKEQPKRSRWGGQLWAKLAGILIVLSIAPILGAGSLALHSLEKTLRENEGQRLRTLGEVGAATVQQYIQQGNEKLTTVAKLLASELQKKQGDSQEVIVARLNSLIAPPDIYLELQYYAAQGTQAKFVGVAQRSDVSIEEQGSRISTNLQNPIVIEPLLNDNNYNSINPEILNRQSFPNNGNSDAPSELIPPEPKTQPESQSQPKTQPTNPPPPKKPKKKFKEVEQPVSLPTPELEPPSALQGLALSAPVSSGTKRLGVLVAYLDLSHLPKLLSPLAAGGGEVRLFDGGGNLLATTGATQPDNSLVERRPAGYGDWILETRESPERLDAALGALRGQAYLWNGVALILAAAVSLGLAAWIVRPVSTLTSVAEAVAKGDLTARAKIERRDEIGRLAAEFDRMTAAIERLDNAKNDFVANVSHELRTPLTSMKLSIANLLDGVVGEITPRQNATLTRLRDDVGRLIELVNTLLAIARLEAGAVPIKKQRLALSLLAREAASALEPLAQERSISLELSGEGEAMVDATMMVRIFSNLFDNAIKYIPVSGWVRAEISGTRIVVYDSGPGIDLAEPFAKFSQGSSRGVKNRGVGLGLALVKKMVELQGGSIKLERGPGARFTIELVG